MHNNSGKFITFILAILLSVIIITRINKHTDNFDALADQSLDQTNGYIQITLNLAQEMESQYQLKNIIKQSKGFNSTTEIFQNLILSDPLIKGRKVKHNPDKSLKLNLISQAPTGEYKATFDYKGHQFVVKAGDKLLGRQVKKITAEKVYMNSVTMLFLYDIKGKRLVKKKT